MIIYSDAAASYVFEESGKLVETIVFDLKTSNENLKKLKNFEWLDSEIKLAAKYKEAKLLGVRRGAKTEIQTMRNSKFTSIVAEAMKKDFSNLYATNLLLAKRAVRDSVNEDLLIMQSINSVDELKLVLSKISQRLREWYELYNPEFSHSVDDHAKFAESILKNDRSKLLKDVKVPEEESMGADLKKSDVEPILDMAKKVVDLSSEIENQEKYLETSMQKRCPNIVAVCGFLIGAKLILLAGSLEKLANYPSSTVQLLGAEKALFRHLRGGNKPPKHGIIVTHPVVSGARNKGKSARIFANKISIAAKVDYHRGKFVGDEIKKSLDDQLRRK